MSDHSDTTQSEVTKEQIREIARKIGEQPGVIQVWLFGSHATGTAGPDSDVDLLAIYEGEPDKFHKMAELDDLFSRRMFSMDILVMGEEEFESWQDVIGTLAYEVSREGRVIHDRAG
ncbi:MAG: nucleotidyltransferase domain-containing protein [Armatimonadota bacterium]|nr:nucleotidyltransferase domain-containing protein [Armatimonadota bacterium]